MPNISLWALLPPIYSALTATGLWVVYFVAVGGETVAPLGSKYRRRNGSFYPPYISMAGNFPPASCIFGEVMNLAAFGGLFIAVLRCLQLKHTAANAWLNVGSMAAFSVACFGMTLVGNFQLFSDEDIHNVGTFLTFGLGTLFCWVQSYITLRVNMKNEGKMAGVARFLLSGFITVSMVFYFCLMGLGHHHRAAQCQWALVMFFLIFISTFAVEFRHNHFSIVCVENCQGPGHLLQTFSEAAQNEPEEEQS